MQEKKQQLSSRTSLDLCGKLLVAQGYWGEFRERLSEASPMSKISSASCSSMDLFLPKAEPISDGGSSTLGVRCSRRGYKPAQEQLQPQGG